VKPTLRQTCLWPKPRAQFAFKDSMVHIICNSHYVSHFAAFFIVTGTKISVVESCLRLAAQPCGCSLSASVSVRVGGGLASTASERLRRRPARPPAIERTGPPLKRLARPHDDSRGMRTAGRARRPDCGRTAKLPEWSDRFNDPSAGSPTETLLRLLLPLGGRV
jgi:hypothetical protein